ncbi:hypothetical protein Dsin_002364 [Dipteronia sinensis]|uniref:RNase H type-1 domain-containing protein n=1 Tax=Dipteronia sinensis TaxID=43782 RepID=A0AAE0EJ70_9ROSI|nr:hypothetical protein Dsin_002364 [Dipteronia sinensis]
MVMASCSLQIAAGADLWAANALAILKSSQFGKDCGLASFTIESDSKRVVNWIKTASHLNSKYGAILGDIDKVSTHWRGSGVTWVPSVCNKVALGLTKEALKLDGDRFWMEGFHQCVRRQVLAELH